MFFLSLRDPGDSVRVSGIFLYDCPPPSIAEQSFPTTVSPWSRQRLLPNNCHPLAAIAAIKGSSGFFITVRDGMFAGAKRGKFVDPLTIAPQSRDDSIGDDCFAIKG